MPLNFSFSTTINMHNPYESPLQVSGLTGLIGQECPIIISSLKLICFRVNKHVRLLQL